MVCLLAVVMLGANDPEMRYERVGHEMMCACGCGQVLLECNHVGCPDSSRMIGELRDQLSSGASDKKILEWFAAKYGATILAAPIRGGFDLVAWIMPIAVFLMATVGTALLIRIWKRRHDLALAGQPAPAALPHTPALDALRERIRKETEY
ncbi:MAG: cytochrome c-type biogenesis protein CcmH [Acidobacteriota bacterium]|nr:cytochrome c-type biogenesis protein CcmH [Acidobacteriota bacterium]